MKLIFKILKALIIISLVATGLWFIILILKSIALICFYMFMIFLLYCI